MSDPSSRSVECAVIPAAGLGTRLRPLTYAFPKEMLPVGRLPVLAHVAAEIRRASVTHALFIVSEAKPQIRAYFGDEYSVEGDTLPPLRCSYVIQQEQRGLGHAISLARDWTAGRTFIVAFGDCIIDSPYYIAPIQRLIDIHCRHSSSATTLVEEVAADRVSRYGIVSPACAEGLANALEMELRDIVEKPKLEDAPSRYAVAARWVLDPAIFNYLDTAEIDSRGEINLTDAVRKLKLAGAGLWAAKLAANEARRDIGNFGTFFDAFVRAAMRDEEYGAFAIRAAQEELNCSQTAPIGV
jgi:UTP--glucose-1-phosphate uridylyltransferase